MPIPASMIFNFLERHEVGIVERYEIASATFGALRRGLRQIVLKLRDSDDQEALEISDGLRTFLSECLTVPVPFEISMRDTLFELFKEPEAVHNRWGSDIRALYETALHAAEGLPNNENPVREKLRSIFRELRSQGSTFKIYCHRRARPTFQSIPIIPIDFPLEENMFLHSVRDYREAEPFDVLIKVGPLRTHGWSSAPDALLTAPRFGTLLQIVWAGCNDEPDFGYDPALPTVNSPADGREVPLVAASTASGPLKWIKQVTRFGEDLGAVGGYAPDSDELKVFRDMDQPREKRTAILVQLNGELGILYPPHSRVFSFDSNPSAREPIALRIPDDTFFEGMFFIMPLVGDVDLGGVTVEHGHYSQIWRLSLEKELRTDAVGLIRRLHASGLNLVYLGNAIRHWCKPPSTVIHAPQQKKHFEILMRVLGIRDDRDKDQQQKLAPFWELAWNEVRRSRGEAIQAGFLEQEIVSEQLLKVLRGLLPQIRENASANEGFSLNLPSGNEIKGGFLFFKVCGIEEGFRAPETELKVIRELNVIDQWRV